jgi:E3 ubiquitin-protein ligase HERC2
VIEISIRQCKSSGIDCKVHGLSVVGRLKSDEDDMAANFVFLASDNEEDEEEATRASQVIAKKVKLGSGVKDIQTQVFVWGLNDKDQLGGPKGSKVCHYEFIVNRFILHFCFRSRLQFSMKLCQP